MAKVCLCVYVYVSVCMHDSVHAYYVTLFVLVCMIQRMPPRRPSLHGEGVPVCVCICLCEYVWSNLHVEGVYVCICLCVYAW
jgi:hypothetical protein